MKKVLFGTTALVLSAGVAFADAHAGVSISGSAAAGIAATGLGDDNTAAGGENHLADELYVYNEVELDFTLSGTSDNGLTFGASVDLNAGTGFDLGDDEFDHNGGTAGLGSVFISGDFGTLTFDEDGTDDLYDDDNSHDLLYEYDMGDISLAVTYDLDGDGIDSEMSASIGYSDGALSLGLTGNDGDTADGGLVADLGYTVSDSLSVSLSHDMPAVGDDVTTLGAVFSSGPLTLDGEVDTADGWALGVTYSAGATTLSASTDDADEWEVTTSYDLGGGLSIEAGMNYNDSMFLGAAMSF
ncbi:MAG: porin [Boseongicola sp.]|nr:porin [Boseongicola sp.]MDD9979685.1 porin [Boseongicola sp.]